MTGPSDEELCRSIRENPMAVWRDLDSGTDHKAADLAAARIDALRAERDAARKRYDDLAEGFWRIVDGAKLRDGVPSNELDALSRLVARAERAEAEAALTGVMPYAHRLPDFVVADIKATLAPVEAKVNMTYTDIGKLPIKNVE